MQAMNSYQVSALAGMGMTASIVCWPPTWQLSWVTRSFASRPPMRSGFPSASLKLKLGIELIDQKARIEPGRRRLIGWRQVIVVLCVP